jgi:hypothetical protein
MKNPPAAGTDDRGPSVQAFDDELGQRGFAAAARSVHDGRDSWRAALVGHSDW